jgi:hypothetical protein
MALSGHARDVCYLSAFRVKRTCCESWAASRFDENDSEQTSLGTKSAAQHALSQCLGSLCYHVYRTVPVPP